MNLNLDFRTASIHPSVQRPHSWFTNQSFYEHFSPLGTQVRAVLENRVYQEEPRIVRSPGLQPCSACTFSGRQVFRDSTQYG